MLIIRQRQRSTSAARIPPLHPPFPPLPPVVDSAALLVNHPSAHVRAEYHPQILLTTFHDRLLYFFP